MTRTILSKIVSVPSDSVSFLFFSYVLACDDNVLFLKYKDAGVPVCSQNTFAVAQISETILENSGVFSAQFRRVTRNVPMVFPEFDTVGEESTFFHVFSAVIHFCRVLLSSKQPFDVENFRAR